METVTMLLLLTLVQGLSIVLADSAYHDGNCESNRMAITHLFEWKWNDIAAECERFLGPMGYCGVQVSPPTENVVVGSPEPMRPWWERYQPISYLLETRSGTEEEFQSMVERCNAVGVRIYVDAVINHMSGMGRSGNGTGGSFFDADAHYFPAVPYTTPNFHDCSTCPACCCINAWMDHAMVRNCRLVGLIDLDQTVPDTQDMILEYMNRVIDMGVAGFRVDAAKHMWPDDLEALFNRLNDLRADVFGSGKRPFIYLEVIDMNQNGEIRAQEYTHIGRTTEFRYCSKIRDTAGALWDILGLYDPGWGMVPPEDAFVFVDNHDNQRGHGAGGDVVTYKDPRKYKIAQAITLSQTYGWPRVMSSYDFTNTDEGPPHDGSYNTADVVINPDGSCGGGWICEHRWQAIAGMASFAKAAKDQPLLNWWNDGNKAAYSRGDRAFVVITNEGTLDRTFYTGLPAGAYCNVIEGCPTSSGCAGKTFTVDGSGNARIIIDNSEEPIAAIHVEAMSGSGGCSGAGSVTTPGGTTTTTTAATTTTRNPGDPNIKHTIIYMKATSNPGQDLFYRGGINHDQRPGCTSDAETSDCAIYIVTNSLGTSSHYDKYNAWRVGNNKLNWYGAQNGQGTYQGMIAEGTPSAWTTNNSGNPGYQPDNSWGDHYWKLDVEMDCSDAENEWFEIKAYATNMGWEADVSQTTCTGTAGGTAPYSGPNHFGRCGYMNVFEYGQPTCIIDIL